jgi:hypothetical protein
MKNYLLQLKFLIMGELKNHHEINVYLFGSRATGRARSRSDVDIGLLSEKPIGAKIVADLKNHIEESSIPYKVDVVDLNRVNDDFRKKALKGAISWKD